MSISLMKYTTQIGSPIQYMYLKRIKICGCVLIKQISIRHAKKIPLSYPESIKLWTPQTVVTQGAIRFPLR
jgi:hypothetical protein